MPQLARVLEPPELSRPEVVLQQRQRERGRVLVFPQLGRADAADDV